MADPRTPLRLVFVAALGLLPVACAQHGEQAPASQGMSEHSNSSSMPGHDMAGMDMSGMMDHCAQMRQQQARGQQLSPDMQTMMAHCDEMDRSMGAMPDMAQPSPANPPAATRLR